MDPIPTNDLVAANEFCISQNVELSFIHSLNDSGLIEMVTVEEIKFIPASQLPRLEKWVRFHYEMNINLEGIETIAHLLQQLEDLQEEMTRLANKLHLYETMK